MGLFFETHAFFENMMKIMFVCHGNICRSPMAEFIFKDMARKCGNREEFFVSSSATSTEELGNPVYPPAKRILAAHGLNCDGKYAVQLKKSDYDNYDMFVIMDENNRRNIMRIFGDDPLCKIHKLMDFTNSGGNVADPWYTGDFEGVYREICDGCAGLLASILDIDISDRI